MGRRQSIDRRALEAGAGFRAYARFASVQPDRNRFRYYGLGWQPSLWGGGALIRTWGRIGTRGRSMQGLYPDRASAQATVERLIRRRLRHGYRVIDAH